ncbi:MAG: TIGR03668 family PPOX class F420-dependent oxidoreductase [Chloroflexi bacterium]|nr:TIGR03668 family PPOX class F420-dependent oxidoreductase [Chloroflexota bacterium]
MEIEGTVRRFIETARSGHLATADSEADPHLVPVTFVLIDEAIYIAIDEKPKTTTRLKRLRNIEENPRAAFLVDQYDDDWTRLAWVLCRGAADVLEPGTQPADAPARDEILAELRAKYPQYHDHDLASRPILRLVIERVTQWGAVEG